MLGLLINGETGHFRSIELISKVYVKFSDEECNLKAMRSFI